jgi:hypothetical protein
MVPEIFLAIIVLPTQIRITMQDMVIITWPQDTITDMVLIPTPPDTTAEVVLTPGTTTPELIINQQEHLQRMLVHGHHQRILPTYTILQIPH